MNGFLRMMVECIAEVMNFDHGSQLHKHMTNDPEQMRLQPVSGWHKTQLKC